MSFTSKTIQPVSPNKHAGVVNIKVLWIYYMYTKSMTIINMSFEFVHSSDVEVSQRVYSHNEVKLSKENGNNL